MIAIVLFGKPGAGKGTQAELLKEKYDLVHISTGELFRKHIKNETPLGILAKSYDEKGALVPDQVTIDMLEEAVDENPDAGGFIFDGFPRTIKQAEALDLFLKTKKMQLTATIALEANDDTLMKRLLERGQSSGRADDQDPSKIQNRFNEYNAKTAPLRTFYQEQQKFHSINGIGTIESINAAIQRIIEQLK